MALKPTSRIGAIFSVLMRSSVCSIVNHLRLAGLAPAFGGDRPFRFGNAGRSGGWRRIGAGGGAIVNVGGARGPRSAHSRRRVVRSVAVWRWWLARRAIRLVRGSGPPLVQSRVLPPGRPLAELAVLDGRGGMGRRAARGTASQVRCLPPPAWRTSTPGRGQQARARGRRPPNYALQVDRLNRADFTRPGAPNACSIQQVAAFSRRLNATVRR
jgi:hypothetical protein